MLGPFFKGSAPPSPRFLGELTNQKHRVASPHHRGFNEPDIHHQAAMNPWHAAAVWPEVERVARNYGVQTLVSALMAFGEENGNVRNPLLLVGLFFLLRKTWDFFKGIFV